jgi:endo-1,4-beta-xylanase
MKVSLIIFLLSIAHISHAGPQNPGLINKLVQPDTPSLKAVVPFPVGAAINLNLIRKHNTYRNTIISQYNSITAENVMKMGGLHPAKDVYYWKDADELVAFARQNNMRVHGHTLIWAANNPKWVNEFQGDKRAWKNLLKSHVQTVVKHFKGKVASWDVINEAFADNGTLKKSIWLEKIGPEYIELAFRYAHEADPKALLFLNEYGQEYDGRRREGIMKMVQDFKKRKVPIHGLGLQMHVVVRISDDNISGVINWAASSGLLVHLSELEISVLHSQPETFQMDSALANKQAHKYKTIFESFKKIPKAQQYGITTWNVGDADAFRNGPYRNKNHDHPMLFDIYYVPKPAYRAIIDAMK